MVFHALFFAASLGFGSTSGIAADEVKFGYALENAQLPAGKTEGVFVSWGRLQQEICDELAAMPDYKSEANYPLPESLKKLLIVNQPISGDFLLTLTAKPDDKLRQRAVNAFVQIWDTMNVQQVDAYFQRAIELKVSHRARYPQEAKAYIEMAYRLVYGWGGWPSQSKLELKTVTKHFVDGTSYGRTFSFTYPMPTTGWIQVDHLSEGEHTASLTLDYEFSPSRRCLSRPRPIEDVPL